MIIANAEIVSEVVLNEGSNVFLVSLKWILLGGAAGGALALAAFFIFLKAGAFKKISKPVKILILLFYLLSFTALLAYAGFQEGILQSTKKIVTQSKFSEEVMPYLGSAGADLIVMVYLVSDQYVNEVDSHTEKNSSADEKPQEMDFNKELAPFRDGTKNIDIEKFKKNIYRLKEMMTDPVVAAIRIDLMNSYPILKNGPGKVVLNWIIEKYLQDLENVNPRISELVKLLENFSASIAEDLTEDGKTISWVRISEFSSREMVSSGIVKPVRLMVRSQQYIFFAIALVLLFMPLVIIKFLPAKPEDGLEDEELDSI